ncbi:MAG TPA: haloacid dehalogenase-like hydrolase [Opitutaceae bacterium]|nr:haloacid dehalogenase-like hydrolase [Opitutaceae bacterium]
MKLLLLWDIDGTLISSGGAGMRALQRALETTFGLAGSLDDIDFAGRTDRWIIRRVFSKFGLDATEENFSRYIEGYLSMLPAELANPNARVLPGVATLLAAAGARADVAQGLLTGNIRRGAEIKLGFHGLWRHFPFGAFADDGEMRNDLGPHALRRAREHAGLAFPADRTWVIGDTPFDIECGRVIGARTLALATGSHSTASLLAHQPSAVLADLSDVDAFWRIVEG